jgi:hypothetical protein
MMLEFTISHWIVPQNDTTDCHAVGSCDSVERISSLSFSAGNREAADTCGLSANIDIYPPGGSAVFLSIILSQPTDTKNVQAETKVTSLRTMRLLTPGKFSRHSLTQIPAAPQLPRCMISEIRREQIQR